MSENLKKILWLNYSSKPTKLNVNGKPLLRAIYFCKKQIKILN